MKDVEQDPPHRIEVEKIKNIRKVDRGNNKLEYYAEINGDDKRETWILTQEGSRISVNAYVWTDVVKSEMEKYLGRQIENPNESW